MKFVYNPFNSNLVPVLGSVSELSGLSEGAVPFGSSTGGLAQDLVNFFYDDSTNTLTLTGDLGLTGTRVTKGWFTDLESTNMPTVGGVSIADTFLEVANNLSDVADVATVRTNIGLVAGGAGDIWVEKAGDTMNGDLLISGASLGSTGTRVTKGWFIDVESTNMFTVGGVALTSTFLQITNNLSDLNNAGTARTNLGLIAGGAGDIWVEKAGDTMSGTLGIVSKDTSLSFQAHSTASINGQMLLSNAGTFHTGFFVSSDPANYLTDTYAWGILGGPNNYVTGEAYSVAVILPTNVPAFRITGNTNMGGGPTSFPLSVLRTGLVGVGVQNPVHTVHTFNTDTSDNVKYGGYFEQYFNPSSARSNIAAGVGGIAIITSGNAQTFASLYGLVFNGQHQGTNTLTSGFGSSVSVQNISSGTITTAIGGYSKVSNQAGGLIVNSIGHQATAAWCYGAGNITNAYAFYAENGYLGSSGIVSNNSYGLYVESITLGSNANFAIFTNAGLIEFNDQLFVDGSQDIIQCLVQGHSTQTSDVFVVEDSAGNDYLAVSGAGSVVVGNAALVTSATDGFLYIPTCAGVPSGVPTAKTGRVALVYDSSNNDLYLYDGGWVKTTTFS